VAGKILNFEYCFIGLILAQIYCVRKMPLAEVGVCWLTFIAIQIYGIEIGENA
jgi:hypothetical protein